MNPSVGIDLGTTNTVIAVQTDPTGPQILWIPQPVDERKHFDSVDHIKSAVYFESENACVVGAFAAKKKLDSFKSIKSWMGTRWRFPHPYKPNQLLTPAYISAHILRVAYEELVKQYPDWDRSAIITVPASFNTDQRRDTLEAARIAGLGRIRLLDEPTAAFYYYLDQNRDAIDIQHTKTVLVFDFGGGTLDVSIIRIEGYPNQLLVDAIGRSRYTNLGGDDVDLDLASFLIGLWERQEHISVAGMPYELRRTLFSLFVQKACEFREQVEDSIANELPLNEFFVDETIGAGNGELRIRLLRQLSRDQYEELVGRFFSSREGINIFRPIGQAFEVAVHFVPGLSKEGIDLILYTGGASRMNGVKAALSAYFTPKECFSVSEEEACNTVALGAASCRYYEQHREGELRMTLRLLESILTRHESGREYVTLVPLTCEPSEEFKCIEHTFRTPRPLLNLKIPLFRGAGPRDHHLSPMHDLVLHFDRVVDAGTPYNLLYRMTANKTVELKAVLTPENGKQLEVLGTLDILSGQRGGPEPRFKLARVNSQGQ
jgi:molecular chaperone DnaK